MAQLQRPSSSLHRSAVVDSAGWAAGCRAEWLLVAGGVAEPIASRLRFGTVCRTWAVAGSALVVRAVEFDQDVL
jgi:hypothetical protein